MKRTRQFEIFRYICAMASMTILCSFLLTIPAECVASLERKGAEYYWSKSIRSYELPYTEMQASITCIDVSDSGAFLLVFDRACEASSDDAFPPHHIEVHQADGEFVGRFSLDEGGSIRAFFDPEDEENVLVYIVREELLLKLSTQGAYIGSVSPEEYKEKIAQCALYTQNDSFEKTINDQIYILNKDSFSPHHGGHVDSFLVKNESKVVVYEYQQNSSNSHKTGPYVIILFSCMVLVFLTVMIKRPKN